MVTNRAHRAVATAALFVGPALAAVGCERPPLECADQLEREVPAYVGAAEALAAMALDLRAQVANSCARLAGALDVENPPIVDEPSQVDAAFVMQTCDLAATTLLEALATVDPLTITLEGGSCDYAAAAQIACEEKCSRGACEAGTVESRCEPERLKGSCAASCEGTCIMESGSVLCAGSCDGVCQGACSGACGPDCVGECDGACTGNCFGACHDVQPAAICEGACLGGCSDALEAPTCVAPISATTCEITEVCAEACVAHAFLGADCEVPTVIVEGNDSMKAILEAHTAPLFEAVEIWGPRAVELSARVAEVGSVRADAAVYQAGCVAEFGVDLLPTFETATQDAASLVVVLQSASEVVAIARGMAPPP